MHFCQLHILKYTSIINEDAFQYDAYRPLVYVSRVVCIQGGPLKGSAWGESASRGVCIWGVCNQGFCIWGLHLGEGFCSQKGRGSAQPPGLPMGGLGRPPSPLVNRMTHRYKNITLPQTSFGAVII